MKHLYLFEAFSNYLNEVNLKNTHWVERTVPPDKLCRTVPRDMKDFPAGWVIKKFVASSGSEIDSAKFHPAVKFDNNLLNSFISKALYYLTHSKRLEAWESPKKPKIEMAELGRIAIWDGVQNFYPYLSSGKDPKDGPGEWPAGDMVWGQIAANTGITVKYYPDTKEGREAMWTASKTISLLSVAAFQKNSEISYPYGKSFEVIIDLTDPDPTNIEDKIKKQIEGNPIILGPAPAKPPMQTKNIIQTRKTIGPGDSIGVILKYVSESIPTMGVIQEIVNMKDIQSYQKLKALDEIKEIKIKFLPDKPNRKFGSDGKTPLSLMVSLKENSMILIDGDSYKILGAAGNKPIITSEPSILKEGRVQTWVETI